MESRGGHPRVVAEYPEVKDFRVLNPAFPGGSTLEEISGFHAMKNRHCRETNLEF